MWRLKLTVKPPDAGSPNDMNIHVGLCWGIEVEGEGALPLSESAMVQVDFDIATWDFVLNEEDPTSSEGPVSGVQGLGHLVATCIRDAGPPAELVALLLTLGANDI